MTVKQMEFAGSLAHSYKWDNEELKLCIEALQLTIAYLRAKGPEYYLAYQPLRSELDQLEQFAANRGLKLESL